MGIKAYPCMERAGIVWAYMGPGEKKPAPPEVEWCTLPASHVFVSKRLQECKYLQVMEGGIDTTHVSYVHRFEVDERDEVGDRLHDGGRQCDFPNREIGLRPTLSVAAMAGQFHTGASPGGCFPGSR